MRIAIKCSFFSVCAGCAEKWQFQWCLLPALTGCMGLHKPHSLTRNQYKMRNVTETGVPTRTQSSTRTIQLLDKHVETWDWQDECLSFSFMQAVSNSPKFHSSEQWEHGQNFLKFLSTYSILILWRVQMEKKKQEEFNYYDAAYAPTQEALYATSCHLDTKAMSTLYFHYLWPYSLLPVLLARYSLGCQICSEK